MSALHYGHPGRDTMLRGIADIWWPYCHREVINTAKFCEDCSKAGKNVKVLQKQSEFGKIPRSIAPNEEIAIDFAGPFQNAKHGKKYLLVSLDNFSAWPEALFLQKPTTKKVIEFLKNYMAQYGVPKSIRSDPGTVFMSNSFKNFCQQFHIKHVTCPVRDHRGNGKIERLIRTINERLRTNQNIIVKKDNSGLSEVLYALRTGKKADGKSPFEKQFGREPNTVKSNIVSELVENSKGVLEQDSKVTFATSDFEEEIDSTILVRERTRGSKLEPTFTKKRGRILEETDHTISFLPQGKKKATKLAKRDVARANNPPEEGGQMKKIEKLPKPVDFAMDEEMSEDETPFPQSRESSEITPIETNLESERETSSEEVNQPDEEPCCSKTVQKKEVAKMSTKVKEAKMEKPAETPLPREKANRRRRPTQRYGIDVVMTVEEGDENIDENKQLRRNSKNPKQLKNSQHVQ